MLKSILGTVLCAVVSGITNEGGSKRSTDMGIKMCLIWCSLCTGYLLTCQMRVTVGGSSLRFVYVTSVCR